MKAPVAGAPHLADAIEAAASRDMYAAAPPELGFHTETVAGATLLLAPRFPVTYFNRAIGLGMERAATESDLDALIAVYRAAGVKDYWVHLSPGAAPAALGDWLRSRGLELPARRSWAKFLRGPEPAQARASALCIRPAARADAPGVAQTVCQAYGLPPALGPWFEALLGRPGWQVYVATAHERIVATGSVYIRGREAWLGIGATLAEYRGRGAQSALLAERIRFALASGCALLATETGEAIGDEPNTSLENIRRCGFTQVCSRLNFAARR